MSAAARAPAPGEPEARLLAEHGILRLRAENPGPLTLSGTNTWVVGSDPAYVVDPGPAGQAGQAGQAGERHLERILAAVRERGGLGGVALTHDHPDHSGAVAALLARVDAPLAAAGAHVAGRRVDVQLADGVVFGPLTALPTPGHSVDHCALIAGRACLCGDAVLGEGSVFISPDPGALAGYLDGLRRLLALPLRALCPGHGPAVFDPHAKLTEYVEHRLERERRLVAALDAGARGVRELLDAAWADVPEQLRPVAAVTLAAHLDKLAEEGRLPAGVQRPSV